jgi:hypothetical protein
VSTNKSDFQGVKDMSDVNDARAVAQKIHDMKYKNTCPWDGREWEVRDCHRKKQENET